MTKTRKILLAVLAASIIAAVFTLGSNYYYTGNFLMSVFTGGWGY